MHAAATKEIHHRRPANTMAFTCLPLHQQLGLYMLCVFCALSLFYTFNNISQARLHRNRTASVHRLDDSIALQIHSRNPQPPTMGSLAELTGSLAGVRFSKAAPETASSHTLNIEFPVTALLADHERLHIPQPSLVGHRQCPSFDQKSAGVPDASIFAMLPIVPPPPSAFAFHVIHAKNSALSLLAAVEVVAQVAGTTTVEVVACEAEDSGTISYRFRFSSTTSTSAVIELNESEWEQLLKKEHSTKWVGLLSNLVHRRSARSYYHVLNRLYAAFGDEGWLAEEDNWTSTWNAEPARDGRELLNARLKRISTGGGSSLIELPCNHTVMVRDITIIALKTRDCAGYSCSTCGARVLQPEDFKELTLRPMLHRAQDYTATAADWLALDGQAVDDDYKIVVPAASLLCALAAALGSLRAPVLICPPALSFLSFPETSTAFNGLLITLHDQIWVQEHTALDWYNSLMDNVLNANSERVGSSINQEVLPSSWSEDLSRWLSRTVRLLAHRGCTKDDPRHHGIHKHRNKLRCGMQRFDGIVSAEHETEEGDEEVKSMAEITAMLSESSIEGDSEPLDDLRALAEQEGIAFDDDADVEIEPHRGPCNVEANEEDDLVL
ncbi:hypothetical protein LTS10_007365 [Elasticomyces elasticus]|nr:hypothetical protein LTS10_007365 [Elasticomyces elasticus]